VTTFKGKPLTLADRQEIARRYEAGETLAALIAAYGRSKPTIRNAILDAGVVMRRRGYAAGTKWSPEWRAAHRAAQNTPEARLRSRQALLKRLPTMRGPAVNTAIEQRMHDALMTTGIGFTTQSLLLDRYLVDIELHQASIVIEADGSQHMLRAQKAKDAVRDADLTEAGYRVFRFTGSAINTDATACVQRVIDACGLTPDEEPVYEIRTKFSGELHPLWKGGKREFVCETCGNMFLAQPKHRTGKHVYCSRKCAGAATRGMPRSAEIKAKISAGNAGQKRGPLSAEHKAKSGAGISAALKGKPKTAEHSAKVAAALKGRTVSPETRAKISASLKRRNASQIKIESELRGDAQRAAEMTAPAALF
jgi:very-short-patch-repair endonuclease